MLCLNPKCRAVLREYQWGEGYCSGECMAACLDKGATMTESLHEPTTGETICRCADEVDAMVEAHILDPRLPRIIYEFAKFARIKTAIACRYLVLAWSIHMDLPAVLFWRQQGMTYEQVGKEIGRDAKACHRIYQRATPNILRRLRLR